MPPRGYTIKRGRFARAMRSADIDNASQLAVAMGMHRSSITRVLAGESLAGAAFVENSCRVLNLEAADLFVYNVPRRRVAA